MLLGTQALHEELNAAWRLVQGHVAMEAAWAARMVADAEASQRGERARWQAVTQGARAQEARDAMAAKLAEAQVGGHCHSACTSILRCCLYKLHRDATQCCAQLFTSPALQVAHRQLQQAVHQLGKHNMALEAQIKAQQGDQAHNPSLALQQQLQQATTDKRLYKALCKVAVAVASDIVNGACGFQPRDGGVNKHAM